MSENRLLALVAACPQRTALARRAGSSSLPLLARLESQGLVSRRPGGYRLTRDGRTELALRRALAAAVARALT